MAERKMIDVDEKYLQQMIAGDIPMYKQQQDQQPENQARSVELPEPKKETRERKRGQVNQSDFAEVFLKENRLRDRRMVYVSKETYEKLVKYVSVISDRNLSMVGYVDNIVSHHIEIYKPAINELYESRIGCKAFKD